MMNNWIYQFLSKKPSKDDPKAFNYYCNVCAYLWLKSDDVKLQTGNIKRHMVRKHKNNLLAAGVVLKTVESTPVFTDEELNFEVMKWITVTMKPLSTVNDPSFRGIISKLGGTLLKWTQLIEKFPPKVMDQTVR